MTRVIGPPRSRRRHWTFVLCLVVTLGISMFFIAGAQAVHDAGVYQLDGNALNTANSTPAMPSALEDADNICAQNLLVDSTNAAGTKCHPTTAQAARLATLTSAATRSGFVTDGSGLFTSGSNDDQWTGGSKDDQNISDWVYKQAASSNDKSDIENAWAAVYNPTTGPDANHKIIYFGGDRISNSGSENTAFWFLQQAVGENPNTSTGCTLASGCPFTGAHTAANPGADNCLTPQGQTTGIQMTGSNAGGSCTESDNGAGQPSTDTGGDVLVVSAFTVGGTQPQTTAYEWVGVGNAPKSLCVTSKCSVIQISTVAPGCDPNVTNDPVCAITNQNVQYSTCPTGTPRPPCVAGNANPITSPWIYSEKSSDNATSGASTCTTAANAMCPGIYFEGGLDLTALGLGGECTSSFTMDTRSSASVDASLQDLAIGQLGSCNTSVTTTPKEGDGTTAVPSDGIPLGTNGKATATDSALLSVQGTTTFTGSIQFYLCGPIATTANCATGGTAIGSPVTANSNATYTSPVATVTSAANDTTGAPGHYCWRAVFTATSPSGLGGASDPPSSTSTSTTECFLVKPVKPTLSTNSTNQTLGAAQLFGQSIDDTATLTGTANKPGSPIIGTTAGAVATGTITITAYGPFATTHTPVSTDCSTANLVYTSHITVSGDSSTTNVYKASGGDGGTFTPSLPGLYLWVAHYSGDNPNTLAADDTACGSTTEQSFVQQIPTQISTGPFVYPNDSATISSTGASSDTLAAGATATFRLFAAGGGHDAQTNCLADSGTSTATGLLYSEQKTLASAAHTWSPSTTNGSNSSTAVSVNPTTTANYWWRVTFAPASTDTAHSGIQSNCLENTSVSVTNDAGPGTAFP